MPFTVTMPKLSPTMEEGLIAKWHQQEGSYVESGAVLLEITTDKATIEHTALDEGWLRKILSPEGATLSINEPIAVFSEEENEDITSYLQSLSSPKEKKKEPASLPPSSPQLPPRPQQHVKASPLARKIAKNKGIDLSTVEGSGPHGRITSKDLEGGPSPTATPPSSRAAEEIPLTPMRKAIARRLQQAKSSIPHFYLKQTIDMDSLHSLREQLKNLGHKITFNDFIISACALALKKHPEANRIYEGEKIFQYQTVDVSVAVTIEGGLITPILRNADQKGLLAISAEIKALAEKARLGKLREEEYQGGSFCVSNLGMFGIEEFSAIINPPQAAILAIGAITEKPCVKQGMVQAGKSLTATLSIDHRIMDGVIAAHFLNSIKKSLENPLELVL